MEKIKQFFWGKGIGYYLTLPAIVFCIVAVCLYAKFGITSFNPELETRAIAYAAVCLVLCAVSFVIDFKPIKYVAFLLCLYSFMWFIYSQVTYIANVFVAIDGYTLTGGFIATAVMYVLSCVFVLLAAVLNNVKPWGKETKSEGISNEC